MLSAVLNAHEHGSSKGSRRVYLTAVGGGVFGNSFSWIARAMERACRRCEDYDLDVHLITYKQSQLDPRLAELGNMFPADDGKEAHRADTHTSVSVEQRLENLSI